MPGGSSRRPGIATYAAIHARVRNSKGIARAHKCVDCGGLAHEWSYDGKDPDETVGLTCNGGYVVTYSQHVEHYEPRCRRCHRQHDRKRGKVHRAEQPLSQPLVDTLNWLAANGNPSGATAAACAEGLGIRKGTATFRLRALIAKELAHQPARGKFKAGSIWLHR